MLLEFHPTKLMAPKSGRGDNLRFLLARTCKCLRRDCLQQFRALSEQVRAKREEFRASPPAKQDPQLYRSNFVSMMLFLFGDFV